MAEYIHCGPDERVDSISGHYVVQKEVAIEHHGREVLVVFGYAVVDKSCCGMTGWRFARVPGYVASWKSGSANNGAEVSIVEPIESESDREAIEALINGMESHCQVTFDN